MYSRIDNKYKDKHLEIGAFQFFPVFINGLQCIIALIGTSHLILF